jgi:hypothetical protein
MADLDDQLHRLLHAARPDSPAPEEIPPLGFATRVLAEYRETEAGAAAPWFALLCRQAVWWAGVFALLALTFSLPNLKALRDLANWQAPELRLVNSAVRLEIP